MEAQVIAMTELGIPACLTGSAQKDRNILSRIRKGEFNIIYSTPEYLQEGHGKELLNILKKRLLLVAIDGE